MFLKNVKKHIVKKEKHSKYVINEALIGINK